MEVRLAEAKDHEAIWEIFKNVIETGDTYVFHPKTKRSALDKYWLAEDMKTFVVEAGGHILGTYVIKPNHEDLGNHIATCSYMVNPVWQGRGAGTLMCEHSIDYAREQGFKGIQFNMVVSTNIGAVKLWEKHGFKIIGTTPGGFQHQRLGLVDTYIMYRSL